MADQHTSWVNPDMRFEVSGWVVDPLRLDLAVPIELWAGERRVAALVARAVRRQVRKLFGGDGRHGFRIILPFEFYNGRTYDIRLIRTDTDEVFFAGAVAFFDLRCLLPGGVAAIGAVTDVEDGGATGWILDPERPDVALTVELWFDGVRLVAQRADLVARGLPLRGDEQRHGFAFRFPSGAYDDEEHDVEVRVQGGPALASAGGRVRLPSRRKPSFQGELALSEAGELTGQIVANGQPDLPVLLALSAGDQPMGALAIESGEPVEFALASLMQGQTLRGSLIGTIMPEGQPMAIEGVAPMALGAVHLTGQTLAVTARGTPGFLLGGIDLLVLDEADTPLGELNLRGPAGDMLAGELQLPSLPQTVALVFAGDRVPLRGGRFDVLSSPGSAERRRARAAGDGGWIDPAQDAVARALDARAGGGLAPEAVVAGHAGLYTYDPQEDEVSGWAIDVADPMRPLPVELVAGDQVIATAVASQSTRVGSARLSAPVGFSFALGDRQLPPSIALAVRLAPGGAPLPGEPILRAPGKRVEGSVDALAWKDFQLTVTGTVADVVRRGQPVPVELLIGGKVVDRVLARSPREGEPGFTFTLSAATGSEGLPERTAVRAYGANLPLPPAILTVAEDTATDAGLAAPEQVAQATEIVTGSFDTLEPSRAAGWALVEERPDAPVDLMLYLDGVPFAHGRTRVRRGDVARKYGGAGYVGFAFELPPNLGVVEPMNLRIEPLIATVQPLAKQSRSVEPRLAHTTRTNRQAVLRARPPARAAAAADISAVVLNQNGEALLDALFASVLAHEPDHRIEWLIVDHVSTDGSEAACARAKAAGLNVRWLPRDANHSFSDSNNWGAERATGEVLVFINNDVELAGRSIGAMAELLAQPSVGMVGLKLLDAVDHGVWLAAPPIQHLGVFFGPALSERRFKPFEARLAPEVGSIANGIAEVPAVTGAFMAMRRADFEALGGFDPRYFYGWEDVDLCLRVTMGLGKRIVSLNERAALHHRGFTRSDGRHKDPRRATNAEAFNRLWGRRLRRAIRRDLLSRPGHWLGHRPVIAFAVTEASDDTSAGDYFTALELGRALAAAMPVHIAYLGAGSWYDLSDVDVLIAMVDRFDPTKVEAARPHLQLIAWARNWFDRWCDGRGIHAFDQVWASSDKAAGYMAERLGREVQTVRIATNPAAFRAAPEADLASDYCFTGSRFGVARDIELDLRPELVEGEGAVFGHGWAETPLAEIERGPVPYSRVPAVYASTKLVLDDANVATKSWGSCNSRVFDALAAGRLVLTNGEEGARELFGDLLPTWSGRRSLAQVINYWLEHPEERDARVAALRERVLAEHIYERRAEQVGRLLAAPARRLKFAIKISATEAASAAWGDFHFAQSLAAAIRSCGHLARVDLRERWYGGLADTDDVVIVLRGILPYEPAPHQVNFCWIISHPDDVSGKELGAYDHVYVASDLFARTLAAQVDVPVSTMFQCTDTSRFSPEASDRHVPAAELLFVGNSRGVEREGVRWALDEGLGLTLYGGGWTTLVPTEALAGRYVPNEILGSLYARATWVLCDHWHDMRRHGFVSNRAFDVLAAGGELIVDEVPGLEIFPDGVHVYRSRAELARIVKEGRPRSPEAKEATARWVAEHHSFLARARVFVAAAEALEAALVAKPGHEPAQPDEPADTGGLAA